MAGEKIVIGGRKKPKPESTEQLTIANAPPPNGGSNPLDAFGMGDSFSKVDLFGGTPAGNVLGNQVTLSPADINLGIDMDTVLRADAAQAIGASRLDSNMDAEAFAELANNFNEFRAEATAGLANILQTDAVLQKSMANIATFLQSQMGELAELHKKIDQLLAASAAPPIRTPVEPTGAPETASTPAGPANVPLKVLATLREAYKQLYARVGGTGNFDAAEICQRLSAHHPEVPPNTMAQYMVAAGYKIVDGRIIITPVAQG